MGRNISIHALLAESDDDLLPSTTRRLTFLSTLSLRRATLLLHQYVHNTHISIHALLAESDHAQDILTALNNIFLSTLSLRRATYDGLIASANFCISIHALLAESDFFGYGTIHQVNEYFYPRSPCGERPFAQNYTLRLSYISIHALLAESDTHLRRATLFHCFFALCYIISIHALLAESDFI